MFSGRIALRIGCDILISLIISAIIITVLSNLAYWVLTILPILHFFHDMVILQVIFTCFITYVIMREFVEEGSSKTGLEHLHNGNTFYNRGHQLLDTHKEGANRIIRTYAAPDGQIVTTISDTTQAGNNGCSVFVATVLVLGIYAYMKLA